MGKVLYGIKSYLVYFKTLIGSSFIFYITQWYARRAQTLRKIFAIDASLFSKVSHSKTLYDTPTRDCNKIES